MPRYTENTVVPLIGLFTTKSKEGFRQFLCLNSLMIELVLHDYNIEDVQFLILPVKVDKEHDVPMDNDAEMMVKGYTGSSDLPDLDSFCFHNQHPVASYGHGHTPRDQMWRMVPTGIKEGAIDWLGYHKDNQLPWRYTSLTFVMDSLYQATLSDPKEVCRIETGRILLDKILTTIGVSYPEWEVKHVVKQFDDFIWKEYEIVVN